MKFSETWQKLPKIQSVKRSDFVVGSAHFWCNYSRRCKLSDWQKLPKIQLVKQSDFVVDNDHTW